MHFLEKIKNEIPANPDYQEKPDDKWFKQNIYFSSFEEGREGFRFLLTWKKFILKELALTWPSVKCESERWYEMGAYPKDDISELILRICCSGIEANDFKNQIITNDLCVPLLLKNK
jgi:hypothetical protein